MKKLLTSAACFVLICSVQPSHANQVTYYRTTVFFHHYRNTWVAPRGLSTSESVGYDAADEAEKAAERVEYCKRFQCVKEIPLPQ
jgi:hypothetical protein